MRARLAALGMIHEANTFAPTHLGLDAFDRAGILRRDEIARQHAGGTSPMAGFLRGAERPGVEIVPLMTTTLTPGGPITAGALEMFVDEMTAALASEGPFDGVLAGLHGAAVAEHVHDVDGYMLKRIRQVVGPDVPIGVCLDLHANISKEMCEHADVLNTYRTNPHVDAHVVAEEIADVVIRTARGEIQPTLAFEPIPALIGILQQNTDRAPMRDVMEDVRELMTRPEVLSATVSEGYPYADVPEMGMAVIVVTNDDGPAARQHAKRLAGRTWERRDEFFTAATDVDQALQQAADTSDGPILLLDVGDNIGGGAPGDSVELLASAVRLGVGSLLTVVADSQAATTCHRQGIGALVTLSIGGKATPDHYRAPVDADGIVLALHNGVYEATDVAHGGVRHYNAGPSAAVRLDTGQTVVLTTHAAPPFTASQLPTLGLEIEDFHVVVAKGVHSPLASYGPRVQQIVQVDTPGITSADVRRFTYQHRRVPLYPFEDVG